MGVSLSFSWVDMTFQLWFCFVFHLLWECQESEIPPQTTETQVSPAGFTTGNSTHTRYCNEDKPENKKREQGSGKGGNTRAVGTRLQPVSSRPNACDHSCKGGLWQPFFGGLKGSFASSALLFTQQCLARPPGSTRLSFRDIIKSSAKGLSSHKVDVRTRCHTNALASPPRHPPTTHG